ncbi:MAG: four helix bundle protein [Bacteroidaceae bacterium]|nr:four helix bundle protein [Bacteroidaceae bacterium]
MKSDMKKENIVKDKSLSFAIRIVNLYKYLVTEKRETVMSKQLLRCGTSIGANIREAEQAQSRADFLSKQNIALKEANETEYWLELLMRTGFITQNEYESINNDCVELNKLLISIIKSTKQPNDNQ